MRTYMCLQTYTGFHSEIILTMTVQAYAEQPATRKASTYHRYVCIALLQCRHCTELKWLCSGSLYTRIWLFRKIVLLCRYFFSFFLTKHKIYWGATVHNGPHCKPDCSISSCTVRPGSARAAGCSCAQGWAIPPPPNKQKEQNLLQNNNFSKEEGIFLLRRWLKPRFAHVCVYSAF